MNTKERLINEIAGAPESLLPEVLDFMEHLIEKHKEKARKRSRNAPKFGSCKGLFIIPDDFDAPLEDFKAYM